MRPVHAEGGACQASYLWAAPEGTSIRGLHVHDGKVPQHSPGAAWRQAAADPDPGELSFCQFQGRAIPVFPDLGDWKEQRGQALSAAAVAAGGTRAREQGLPFWSL